MRECTEEARGSEAHLETGEVDTNADYRRSEGASSNVVRVRCI